MIMIIANMHINGGISYKMLLLQNDIYAYHKIIRIKYILLRTYILNDIYTCVLNNVNLLGFLSSYKQAS